MGYYVGAISENRVWRAFDQRTSPFDNSNTFSITNTSGALFLQVAQYYRAKYELPQGSILAKITINGRVVVEDIPVVDRLVPSYANIHSWSLAYDIAASDLAKISGDQPLVVNRVQVNFYLNEEGLRSISITEQDISNAFNFFKQEVLSFAYVSGRKTFTFTDGFKHDFTSNEPFTAYLYSFVDELGQSGTSTSGVRVLITPLVNPDSFGVTALFKVEIHNVFFDAEGVVDPSWLGSPVSSYTLSDSQLSLAYKGASDKEEKTLGPVSYGPATSYRRETAVLDDLPTSSYVDGAPRFDPNGSKGFYFLQPTIGRIGFAANLLVGEILTKLSLSLYFSVKRDVTAELLVQAHSDLALASHFLT